jgi:hypothetical protein
MLPPKKKTLNTKQRRRLEKDYFVRPSHHLKILCKEYNIKKKMSLQTSKKEKKPALHYKVELYDQVALKALLVHPDVTDETKTLLKKYPKPGKDMSSIGQLKVEYSHAIKGPEKDDGRVYATRGSQGIWKDVRAELGHRFYHDIDIVCAHPTLILHHAIWNKWEHRHLKVYVEHRDTTLASVEKYYSVKRSEAKQLFNALVYGGGIENWEIKNKCGRPNGPMPALVKFKDELQNIMHIVWNEHRVCTTFKKDADEHSKMRTNMAAWVGSLEYSTLKIMDSVASEMGESPDVLTHDGVMIRKRPQLDQARLDGVMRAMEARIKEKLKYDLKLVEKPMERTLDMNADALSDAPTDDNVNIKDKAYLEAKKRFEEKHFKVVRPCSFGTLCEDGTFEFCKREEFQNRHEDFRFVLNGKQTSFLKFWLTDPDKRSYPGKDFRPFPEDANLPEGWLNTFPGFAAAQIPANSLEVSIEPFLDHVRLVCGDPTDPVFDQCVDYLLSYFAHMFQFPGKKPNTALILFCKSEGSGKSKIVEEIGRLLGDTLYYATSKVSDFTDIFSVARAGRILAQMEEAEGAQTNKNMAFFKDMVTSTKVNSTIKNQMQTTQLACDRCIITTNNPDCMAVTTESRRLTVLSGSPLRCRDRPYWAKLFAWYDVPANRRAMYDYLMTYPGVKDKDWVRDRPITTATLRMSVDALPAIMHFLAMVTRINTDSTEDAPPRSGSEWYRWFKKFENTENTVLKDQLTKRTFLCQFKDLSKKDNSGVLFKKDRTATTYMVDAEQFTAHATALGLTDAPDYVSYAFNDYTNDQTDE